MYMYYSRYCRFDQDCQEEYIAVENITDDLLLSSSIFDGNGGSAPILTMNVSAFYFGWIQNFPYLSVRQGPRSTIQHDSTS